MKLLGIPGGSTKGIGIVGILEALNKQGITWDIMVGTSIGAILLVPTALGLLDEVKKVFLNVDLNDIFKVSPVNKKHKLSVKGIVHLIKTKTAVGDMSNVKVMLSKIVTPERFEEYKSGDYAVCYAAAVNFSNGKQVLINLKECEYDEFLDAVLASASIPVFTLPVFIDGQPYFDGGVRDHVANHKFLNETITECYTIFTRPEDYKLKDIEWKADNVIKILSRTIDIMNIEISKGDELLIDTLCTKHNIKNYKLYLPSILETLYDIDKERLQALYEEGIRIGNGFQKEILI